MARDSRSGGTDGRSRSSRKRSSRSRDSQQGSGQGRGWHGDPQGHARAARGEEVRGSAEE